MKGFVFFPFLFVFYIILTPLLQNLGQIDPYQALLPLIVLLIAAALGMSLLNLLFQNWRYSAYLIFLILLFLFLPGHLDRVFQASFPNQPDGFRIGVLIVLGVIRAVLAIKRVWLRLGGPGRVTPALNFILVVALASQILTASPKLMPGAGQSGVQTTTDVLPLTGKNITLDCSESPDIYYIVMDAHGRFDILNKFYGVNDTHFRNFLKEKGFFIADQGHSNYIQTIYSISSSLNFSYIPPEPEGVNGAEYFTQRIAQNQIMNVLSGCGYRTVAFSTGFYFTNHPDVTNYLSSSNHLSEFENLLLTGTPLEGLMNQVSQGASPLSYQGHREQVLFDLNQLSELPNLPGPKFVFAHIISPHPPFVFDAQGKPVQPSVGFSFSDGSDFSGSWEEYQKGYAGQVQFIDRMLEKVIGDILAKSDKPPVIIIQGDHGSGGFLDWTSPDKTCLLERTSILNAYYLPGKGSAQLYPSITPVNSFRVVLNAYFGTHLELEQDKTYFTSTFLPRQVIDITDRRDSLQNCPRP